MLRITEVSAAATIILLVSFHALAASTTIYSFRGGALGIDPQSGLVSDANGVLYGTTSALDSNSNQNSGTIFSLTPPKAGASKWTQTVLHVFTGQPSDGANPIAGLVMDGDGNLYGSTQKGGPQNSGTAFELSPPTGNSNAWTETLIYHFPINTNIGTSPNGTFIRSKKGVLYGEAAGGGNKGFGTVYQLSPPGKAGETWTATLIYSFLGGTDGVAPGGGLYQDGTGAFYGTTVNGGDACVQAVGCGTVFMLTPPANGQTNWSETILHAFANGTDGAIPAGNVVGDSAGNIYGTTPAGGNDDAYGIVFELSPPGPGGTNWTETLLHVFTGTPSDGAGPYAGLIRTADGTLYGTTEGGGTHGGGTAFRLTPPAGAEENWTAKVLFSFGGTPSSGSVPLSDLLLEANGDFFGTTSRGGGKKNAGTVFMLKR